MLKIEFNSESIYADNDKYIKAKIKKYDVSVNTNLHICCQSKEKLLSSKIFGRMQIWTKKDKIGKPYWWWFRKKVHLMSQIMKLIMILMIKWNLTIKKDNDESDE